MNIMPTFKTTDTEYGRVMKYSQVTDGRVFGIVHNIIYYSNEYTCVGKCIRVVRQSKVHNIPITR